MPMPHRQAPKIPYIFTYKAVWQSSNLHIQTCATLAKHLQKPLMSLIPYAYSQASVENNKKKLNLYYSFCTVK